MDSAGVGNVLIALISAVLGAVLGHWLSTNEDRKRHRFEALMAIDKMFTLHVVPAHGGTFAHNAGIQADLITLAVQTQNKAIWKPIMELNNAIQTVRGEHGGNRPPADSSVWDGYDQRLQAIHEAVARAKAKAIAAYVQPWYKRLWVWSINRNASRPRPSDSDITGDAK